MKKLFLFTILLLAACGSICAQQSKQAAAAPPADSIHPTAEQQKAIDAALAAVEKASTESALAQAKHDAAKAKAQSVLYQIMALLRISPAEFSPVIDEKGKLRFDRAAAAPPK